MNKVYKLTTPLSTEYEWDKGPMPSGYAKVKLRIEPLNSDATDFKMVLSPGRIWQVRETDYVRKESYDMVARDIKSFMPTIIKGSRQGGQEALLHTLDFAVNGVVLTLEQVTIDPVHSTEKAFFIATRTAVKLLLEQAKEGGLLKVCDQ